MKILAAVVALLALLFVAAQSSIPPFHVGGEGCSGVSPHQLHTYVVDVNYAWRPPRGYQQAVVDALVPGNGFVLESVEHTNKYAMDGSAPRGLGSVGPIILFADGKQIGGANSGGSQGKRIDYGPRGVVVPGGTKLTVSLLGGSSSTTKGHIRLLLHGYRF